MTDESLFREVDEEVRQDAYKKIWDRYGNALIALAAIAVLSVAGVKGWQYYQQTQSEAAAVVYFDALDKAGQGKFDDALGALAAVNHEGYRQLARLRSAAVLAEKGEIDKAVAAYDEVAASAREPSISDLARIRAGYLLADTSTPDALLARLGQYDKDSSVWRHHAREIFGIAAWRAKDYAMADRYMNAIFADPEAPAAMRQRAQMMIQLITPELPAKTGG